MLDIGIDVKGLKEMEKALLEIAKEVGTKKAAGMMTLALKDGAKKYENSMRRNAPESSVTRFVKNKKGQRVTIRPGFLKSRIKIRGMTGKGKVTKRIGENVVSHVKVGVFKVPYIVPIEYGTSKMDAHPFIRKAFSTRTKQVLHVINDRLAKRIAKAQQKIQKRPSK